MVLYEKSMKKGAAVPDNQPRSGRIYGFSSAGDFVVHFSGASIRCRGISV
jgi:hypothetical protein